ncbi:DEAD/DEAH box helicase [uncultured Serinicoccus sp.]|uniref:DEAD/DEAH box helicase n=1 Tax=uncultured Serinicoccus sp. TaxID=735514 RepID=UPI0026261C1D|nr:DEAD/DEAH box helicase [uncultured Serinicoccus sp.]
MSELLPTLQARELADGLVNYLTTTFALADAEPRRALQEFLEDPQDGLFKGPYLRLRLPFRQAEEGWEQHLEWRPPFAPYRHQAQAYARLSSLGRTGPGQRPLPTLVTTGTGSGKTEAFLHPILDHVLRSKRDGVSGTKAIILYPMNALADDQAKRLTELLTTDPALSSVTAAVYTGNQAGPRTTVSQAGLITDRAVIRDSAPDILLTNYKMLDQLLLRAEDRSLWEQSALSLTYLVLDEFHTYDGAQGTDVAILLRRLGIALKSQWPDDHPDLTDADRARPLGRLTPVATSATLGDEGDPAVMLSFARTVFGEQLDEDAVVTESRLTVDEWGSAPEKGSADVTPPARRLDQLSEPELEQLVRVVDELEEDPAALTAQVLAALHDGDVHEAEPLTLVRRHADVRALVEAASEAAGYDTLVDAIFRPDPDSRLHATRVRAVEGVVAALSHVRAVSGRDALGVELNFWVRELTRIDRVASAVPAYHWSDDGAWVGSDDDRVGRTFPAVYCRHCGRSGWGVTLAAVGEDLTAEDTNIRRDRMAGEGRFRALLHAPAEDERVAEATGAEGTVEGLRWLSVTGRRLLDRRPDEDDPEMRAGRVLPVLTRTGKDADERARADDCPSCQQADGIRFLGSAIATMLSVTLSVLFGNPALDAGEKKSLVFTDSVQDAAHRAGFVQARSHSMTLRASLRAAVGSAPTTLESLVDIVLAEAGDDPFRRYRLVPPDCLLLEPFARFWSAGTLKDVPGRDRDRVKKRLLLDASLEVGLQSTFGRTLEATGSIVVSVAAGPATRLLAIARDVLGQDEQELLPVAETGEGDLTAWVRGTLEHIRHRGGIDHDWLRKYVQEDGRRYRIWGGRPKGGMPAFPRGRSAPAFPRVGPSLPDKQELLLDPVRSPQSWYARWAAKCLGVNPQHGAKLAERLLAALAAQDVLTTTETQSRGTAYGIAPGNVVIEAAGEGDFAAGRTLLVCDLCRDHVPASPEVVGQLDGAPCTVVRCTGRLRATARDDNFYRRLYASVDMRRVVAREHTGLLEDDERREIEEGFKASRPTPDAPNVLVATPTLEMGIDIGDLSTVMLASLPDSVAKYLQRVGRAGRLTGNALNLAFVTGRGDQLPRLGNPLSVINGQVRPPATYLDAEEILRRQYLASIVDAIARAGDRRMPRRAADALRSSAPGTFLGDVIAEAEERSDHYLDTFLGSFDTLDPDVVEALRAWASPDPEATGAEGESLAALVHRASQEWASAEEGLERRRAEIEDALPGLRAAAEGPAASDDDTRDYRTAVAAERLTRRDLRQLRNQHWVSALEERGILPNYTLLDDIVTLEARVTWVDPETGQYESEGETVQRASAQALRELAPGATFYTRGLAMRIDGLDLGQAGAHVRSWVWCAHCGYAVDAQAVAGPSVCPRCGSAQLADTSQRFDAVRLTHVYSEVRRDRDLIDDQRDERTRTSFSVVAAADLDPSWIARQWKVAGGDFGVAHHRRVDLRWVNVGTRSRGAVVNSQVAGVPVATSLFRVCAGCGKLDTTADHNSRDEHRPWCRYRRSNTEDTRTVALTRELRTQGVVVTLPVSATLGDAFAVPSLAASLLLGLREEIGGAPDHLQVETVPAPVPGGAPAEVREALLLHDLVPGGTGYLADLASPERVWRLLVKAYAVLAECPCRDEGRLSCYRCLLPHSRGRGADSLSRVSAERHLRGVLGLAEDETWRDLDTDAMRWTVEDGPVGTTNTESVLELLFRKVLAERLAAAGATVKEKPGPTGNELTITGLGQDRVWRLSPQVLMHGCKPDFVLRTDDPNVAPVAIFADGWTYHASPAHNRIEDDAAKRATLRDNGIEVLSVTHADLQPVEGSTPGPDWLRQDVMAELLARPAGGVGAGIGQGAVDEVRGGPLSMLLGRLQRPYDNDPRTALGRALGLVLAPDSEPLRLPADRPLAEAAAALLDGVEVEGAAGGLLWRRDHLVVLSRLGTGVETVVMLDDRDTAVDSPTHKESWQEWLRIGNAVTSALPDVAVTARTAVEKLEGEPAPTRSGAAEGELTGPWAALEGQQLTSQEKALATRLAALRVPVPEIGVELAGGLPADLVWTDQRVVVLLEPDPQMEADLRADAWTVLAPDPELIAAALTATEGR